MSAVRKTKFIAVEGPIGVGKTVLATKLAQHYQAELVLEDAQSNPFLPRFYQDPIAGALPTQLYFLFERVKQLAEIKQSDMFIDGYVSDFLMDKDRLFAQVTLDHDELQLYNQVYDSLTIDTPQPDLVIYLQAPVEVLLERLRRRGHSTENNLQKAYLQRICDAYLEMFHYYTQSPLLMVNATELDIVNQPQHYQQLLERIEQTTSGRHYFNPNPDLL